MGRPVGAKNVIGQRVKANVVGVFDHIGGRDKMAEWALENLTEFYRLYARLIPTEVMGTFDVRDITQLSAAEIAQELAEIRSLIAGDSEAPAIEQLPGELH